MRTPWGLDPNSDHQMWSRWTFSIAERGRHVPRTDVEFNVANWLWKGFGSVGAAKVDATERGWRIECHIEGPPAHDPEYVNSVRHEFNRFVFSGWGLGAMGTVEAKVLAGDQQDGVPRQQLIVMPETFENWSM